MNLLKEELLEKYKILKAEMKKRNLRINSDTDLDRALFRKAMYGIDVSSLGDIAIVPDYISIAGSLVKSPKTAKDVDVVIREDEDNRDEGMELKLARLIQKHIHKDCHFIYAPKGPHSDYLPLFDLVLRAKDETKRVKVKEDYGKVDEIEKGIRPAFGSPGGKRYLAKTIVSYIPEHKVYVEPFVGGGAIFFAKEPSEVEIINDLDPEIAFAYRFIKNLTDEKLSQLRRKDWTLTESKFARLKESKPINEIDKFYRFIMLKWGSFSSRGDKVNPLRLNQKWDGVNRLISLKNRLSKVIIYNRDYKKLKDYDDKNTFYYLAPPYPNTANFEDLQIDVEELNQFVKSLKGRFILSLPDTEEIRKTFADFEIKRVKTGKLIDEFNPKLTRVELLISNFPLKKQNIYLAKSEKDYFEGLDEWKADFMADYLEMSKNIKGKKILSLGCGTGRVEKALECSGYEVEGVDNNDIALAMAKKKRLKVKKVDLEKEALPYENDSFDTVIGLHILEHLKNPEKLIKEAKRVAKERVIFIVPLGERMDITHKQTYKTIDDFRKLFDKAKVKKVENGDNTAIAIVDVSKIEKAKKLTPFTHLSQFPKPTMAGLTEAFSVEQIWDWCKGRLPLIVEPKLNGFRVVISKQGDKYKIITDGMKDRTKYYPSLKDTIEKIPDDFILDCSLGIERDGKPLPRIKLMTLMADKPELQENDVIVCTVFDLPYWKEDIHNKPFSERRKLLEQFFSKYLKGSKNFDITKTVQVKNRSDLEKWFKEFAKLPQSEGIMIKDPKGIWPLDGRWDDVAKLKVEAEIKVIVLERIPNKAGGYNYRCGVLPGDSDFENLTEFRGKKYIDLGKTYNTEIKAEEGDVLTVGVEEIIPKGKILDWLGPRVIDVDKDRKQPYFANQIIGIAERANILQKRVEGNITYKVGDVGRSVLQLHIMGIEEEKIEALKKVSREAVAARYNPTKLKMLLKGAIGEQGAHIDLRMVKKGDDHFEGGEIMIGNLTGLDKLKKLAEGGKLRFGWKVPRKEEPEVETVMGPVSWMEVGKNKIEIMAPGTVGATKNKYGAMLILDEFTWKAIEPQDDHAKKFEFKGNKLIPEGTYLIAYVPITEAGKKGPRVWMISKLKEKVEKLHLEEFRQEGFDEDIKNPAKYLGNQAYSNYGKKGAWKDWTMDDILHYYARIVDALRSIYFPVIPPKIGDKEYKTPYWECYRRARKYMKTKPPNEDKIKEWDKKREEIIKQSDKDIILQAYQEYRLEDLSDEEIIEKIAEEFLPIGFDIGYWKQKVKEVLQSENLLNQNKFEKFVPIFDISKKEDEHIVMGIVYEPNEVDSQGDFTTEEEIRKAAYQFMEEVQKFKINHKGDYVAAKVLESYVAPQDLMIRGQKVKKGSWILTARILDEDIWKRIKAGEITGYSMAGRAAAST